MCSRRRDARDILHDIPEHLRHIGLHTHDGALDTGRHLPEHLEALLIAWAAWFQLIVLAAHHGNLHNAVALAQQVKVFVVRYQAAFCRYHKGVVCMGEYLQAFIRSADFFLHRLEGVAHPAPVDRNVPVAPFCFEGALALDKRQQAFWTFVRLNFVQTGLFLHKTIPAPVRASPVGIEPHRQIAQDYLAAAFASHQISPFIFLRISCTMPSFPLALM